MFSPFNNSLAMEKIYFLEEWQDYIHYILRSLHGIPIYSHQENKNTTYNTKIWLYTKSSLNNNSEKLRKRTKIELCRRNYRVDGIIFSLDVLENAIRWEKEVLGDDNILSSCRRRILVADSNKWLVKTQSVLLKEKLHKSQYESCTKAAENKCPGVLLRCKGVNDFFRLVINSREWMKSLTFWT